MRKFIFMDTEKIKETILPVTPPSFEMTHGINIETIKIHKLGDVTLPGYSTLPTIKIDCMLPSKDYTFNQPGARLDPYWYLNKFIYWCDNHTILRFIVSGTSVNEQILISDITYGEKDGTNDVYVSINARGYRSLFSNETDKTGNAIRGAEKQTGSVVYVIKSGDTLSAICRKYYGQASLYNKLAAYNGIKNPNLIYAGHTLKIPEKSML